MAHRLLQFAAASAKLMALSLSLSAVAAAQSGLKTINPPQGGKILYGQGCGCDHGGGRHGRRAAQYPHLSWRQATCRQAV